ncbi:MICOS complex subunit MIC27 isoform X2 [Amyelois transitella]|uniref:MICOS complex subunit MIC27 isoform X2 n=1 Tax=Amyelois transitella TaxID=680683 RepID=UPI0029900133|nr:MICOS complex subunit MIC27 isoform X2 [Amyelois transitella]
MLRKAVFGSGLAALVPSVHAATPLKEEASGPAKPPLMKLSELPIYETPHADYVENQQKQAKSDKPGFIREALQTPVRAVRESIQTVLAQTESVKNTVEENYHDVQDKTDWIVKYLREEENKDVRYGAVAMGGLTGFILGLRGGIIRRVFYAGVGTTAMGMICFPEDTKELMKSNGVLAKQYINIAYNFLYGEQLLKDDDVDDMSIENQVPISRINNRVGG